MIKVRATNAYKDNNITDKELNHIPYEGEEFEINDDRLDILSGNNKYKLVFVKVVEETKTEDKLEEEETKTEDKLEEEETKTEDKLEEEESEKEKIEKKAIIKETINVKKAVLQD